jgi:hypothetical protein
MPAPIVTTGDDVLVTVTLYDNGAPVNVTAGSISACIQDGLGNQLVTSTAQSSGTAGASFSTGVVVCYFPASICGSLRRGDAWLEVQWTNGSGIKRTWPLIALEVQQGSIA